LSVRCTPACSSFVVDDKVHEGPALNRLVVPTGWHQLDCIGANDRQRLTVSIRPGKETVFTVTLE
jgi:hypothetical protein